MNDASPHMPSCPAQAGHPVNAGVREWLLDHPFARVMTNESVTSLRAMFVA